MKKDRVMRWFMCLVLVMTLGCLGANAEEMLSVDLKGLSLTDDSNWRAVALNAVFDVMDAQGNDLGAVAANATQAQAEAGVPAALPLPAGAEMVLLIPRQDTLPAGYAFDSQYEIKPEGGATRASLFVYKEEGLLSLTNTYTDGRALAGAVFELVDSQGNVVLTLVTDERGQAAPAASVAAGTYRLRQIEIPQDALPCAEQTVVVPVYQGQEGQVARMNWVNENAPLDQLNLSNPTAEVTGGGASLYEDEQEFTLTIQGGLKGENQWPLHAYRLTLTDLAVLDAQGQAADEPDAVYISELSYHPGSQDYVLAVDLLNSQGVALGETILLREGETLTNRDSQVAGLSLVYQNNQNGEAVVQPGFDAGSLVVKVRAAQRVPHQDKPDAAAVALTVHGDYQLTFAGGEGPVVLEAQPAQLQVMAPVEESFAVSAALTADAQGKGELILRNEGTRTLPASEVSIKLPKGWRMDPETAGQIIRMVQGDCWALETQALAPGEEAAYSLTLSAYTAEGEGVVYWKKAGAVPATLNNPAGLIFAQSEDAVNPADGLTGYAAIPFSAMAQGEKQADILTPVQGVLYEDVNANSSRDGSEIGQAGLQVEWQENSIIHRAFTDEQGRFEIDAAPQEHSSLTAVLPDHMMMGLQNGSLEIPYTVTCRIGGQVLLGEMPLAGVTVTTGDVQTVTDETGAYAFSQLVAGEYLLTFTLPESLAGDYGFADGSFETWQAPVVSVGDGGKEAVLDAQVVRLGGVVLEADGLHGVEAVMTVNGQDIARAVFADGQAVFASIYPGDYQITVAMPQGMMLADLNGYATAQKDAAVWSLGVTGGETGLYRLTLAELGGIDLKTTGSAAMTFTLTDSRGVLVAEALVDQQAAFDNLLPGDYVLTCALPANYLPVSSEWQKADHLLTLPVSVAQGQRTQAELVIAAQASIEGFVFEDNNGSSVKDGKEKGVKNVTVTLHEAVTGGTVASSVTDAEGSYRFDKLLPGEYYLSLPVQKDYAFKQSGNGVIGADGQSDPFALQEGDQLTNMNGALVAPTSLKAVVFIDANENGERGTYERLLEGAVVTLLDSDGNTVAQGTTNKEGELRLTGLAPGTYSLRFDVPEGYAFGPLGKNDNSYSSATDTQDGLSAVAENVELIQGTIKNIGCGVVRLGAVAGKVWYDTNADGVMDEDEPGQAGVRIILTPRRAGGQTYETVTDETGVFLMDWVRAASYTMTAELPDGMMVTRYSATGGDRRSIFSSESQREAGKVFVVKAGETDDNLNIGVVTGAAIEGKVFLDPDYDGLYMEGDAALSGVQVTLQRISTGEMVDSVKTDETGAFCFDALRGGEYRLRITLPEENVVFTKTVDRSITGNWVAARASRVSLLNNLELADMERKTVMIGTVYTGTVEGSVYLDHDYSGTRENGEEKASGMKVRLVNEAGEIVAEDRVNAQGTYLLEDVTPGTYHIEMECADGYVFSRLGENNVFTSVNDEGDGVSPAITVAMGAHITDQDAGMVLPGQVSGMIFNDTNDNGLFDKEEGGLANVMVTLVNREDQTTTALVTGEDGLYSFNRVMPGEYYVHYALPEGGVFARQVSGGSTLVGEGAQAASEVFQFKTAEKKEMSLGGALILAAYGGVAFEDLNGSSVMDDGEQPMAGLTITLGDASVTTGADGHFSIEGVRPGDYNLTLSCPEGYVFSRGNEEATPRGENDYAGVYHAVAGVRDVNQQIGLVRPAVVSGHVWMDEDLSALWEENEAMVAGVDVTLRDLTDGETLFTCSTDESGAFTFAGLAPGQYEAYLDLPEGSIASGEGDSNFKDNGQGQLAYPAFTIAAQDVKDDLVAGIVRYTTVAGMAWLDQGGLVMPLADVSIRLMDENGVEIAAFTTGETGEYAFDKVMPGVYTLEAELPGDYLLVNSQDERVNSGDLMSVIDTDDGGSGASHAFRIAMGEHETAMDIGAVKPGMLGDTVWLDENGNGLQDTGEAPLKGIRIALTKNGQVVAETTTDVYGYFLFTDVYPSHYDVQVEWHKELIPTRHRTDIDLLNSELEESEETSQVVRQVNVASNVKDFDFDLGFKLRKEGVYPAEMEPAPTQVWK